MDKLIRKSLKVFLIFVSLLMVSCLFDEHDPPTQYPEEISDPDFAYDGQNFFIVWGGDNIYGRVLSPEGDFVTPIFEIANSENVEAEPEVAFLDPSRMVIWEEHLGEDNVRICYKRYNRKYSPTSDSSFVILRGEGLSSPRIEKHSNGFVVMWFEWDAVFHCCYCSLFPGGAARDLGIEEPSARVVPLVRADNEDKYFLDRENSAEIMGEGLQTINDIDMPDRGESYTCYGYDKWINIAVVDTSPNFAGLAVTRVSSDGTVIPPRKIAVESEGNGFFNITVCAGDNIFLCIWQSYDGENIKTNYIRLDSDGNVIDDKYFVLFEGIRFRKVRLEYAENKFFLLWQSWAAESIDEKIFCSILSQEGDSLSARTITISE